MMIPFVLGLLSSKWQLDFKKNIDTRQRLYRRCGKIFLSHRINTTDQLLNTFFTHSIQTKVATWI